MQILIMWGHNHIGRKFELRRHQDSLKYLFKQPHIDVRQRIWMEFLCEYDFEIKHIKGKENKLVDTKSKRSNISPIGT